MGTLTLAAALDRHRTHVFAPMRRQDPAFTPSDALLYEADEAFYRALGLGLRHLTPGVWSQFVMLHVARDTQRLDTFLRDHVRDLDALLAATLESLL